MRREAGSLLVLLLGRTFFGICLVQCSEEAAAGQLFAKTLWQRFAEKEKWLELFSLAQQLSLDNVELLTGAKPFFRRLPPALQYF